MARRGGSTLHRATLLALLAVVAGVLTAGIALPAVGGLGWLAVTATNSFNKLPAALTEEPLAQRSVILASDGSLIATLHGSEDRVLVQSWQIPPVMRRAIVAIEDQRFYEHHGVDPRSVLRALKANSSAGTVTQGGSTLTQQYVKNVLLENAATASARAQATDRSFKRKIKEARYALALERRYSKDEILAKYLNIAYFGDGAYGVGTAAQHYFGVAVGQLTLPQAALLAGTVNSPSEYDPRLHPKAARERRDTVLTKMGQLHYYPPAAIRAALRSPLGLHLAASTAADPCALSSAPFFCTAVVNQLLADPALGGTPDERSRRLFSGGLRIMTTLDPAKQNAADAGISQTLDTTIRQATAVVEMEPGTGKVLALAQNRRYGTGPGATKQVYALLRGPRAGSTFKAVTLAAAITAGIPLSTAFNSPACYHSTVYDNPPNAGHHCAMAFSNAGDSEAGRFDMRLGTAFSVNTYFIQLEERVGLSKVAVMARNLGIASPDLVSGNYGGSLTLGALSVDPMDMATAYATLAAHGVRCDPLLVTGVTAGGQPLPYTAPAPCRQVIDAGVADTVTGLLRGVIDIPGATGNAHAQIGRPAAGKTGTTDNSTATWFVGYVPQLVTADWIGDPRGANLTTVPICSHDQCYYDHLYGGDISALIWARVMRAALAATPVQQFADANPTVGNGTLVPVPGLPGQSVAAAIAALATAGFAPSVGAAVDSTAAAGTVASTDPPAGSLLSPGSPVVIHPSTGKQPPRPTPTVTDTGPASATPSAPGSAPASAPGSAPATSPTPPRRKHK